MKKILILILATVPFWSSAQDANEGEIIYEQYIKIEFDRSKMPEHMRGMEDMIPKEMRFKKQLLFDGPRSMYKTFEDPDAEAKEVAAQGPQRGPMHMRRGMAQGETYIDTEKKILRQKQDFFGRTFIITDTVKQWEWKLTGQQKEILGFNCMEATAMRDTNVIVAWFAPTIPASVGPEGFGQLPGAILEVIMRDGKMTITAQDYQPREVQKGEIEEPKKGKEVTREEFREIMHQKREEMREAGGGRHGGMMIHHR